MVVKKVTHSLMHYEHGSVSYQIQEHVILTKLTF